MATPGTLRGSLEYYRAFADDAAANKAFAATKLEMPVLGIGGDRLGPVLTGIAAAIATKDDAVTIKECGHWVVEERTAEFLAALDAFLG